MMTTTHSRAGLIGLVLLAACRAAESDRLAEDATTGAVPRDAASMVGGESSTFAYLLGRYDANGDGAITPDEYTRHDEQFARWDTDGDGRVTDGDWSEDLQVGPQIMQMQRTDALGRYFQTDENGEDILTIDELANAFFEYEDAGTFDESLTEPEFQALAGSRTVELPGDGSMMMQSYVGEADGWSRLLEFYDDNLDLALSLEELSTAFEDADTYELRFDQVRFDGGAAGAHFDELEYEAGLVAGSEVPDVTLADVRGGAPVNLLDIAGEKPIALIFGSYT